MDDWSTSNAGAGNGRCSTGRWTESSVARRPDRGVPRRIGVVVDRVGPDDGVGRGKVLHGFAAVVRPSGGVEHHRDRAAHLRADRAHHRGVDQRLVGRRRAAALDLRLLAHPLTPVGVDLPRHLADAIGPLGEEIGRQRLPVGVRRVRRHQLRHSLEHRLAVLVREWLRASTVGGDQVDRRGGFDVESGLDGRPLKRSLVQQVLGGRPGVERSGHRDQHRKRAESEHADIEPASSPEACEERAHFSEPRAMSTRRTKKPSSVSSNSTREPGG